MGPSIALQQLETMQEFKNDGRSELLREIPNFWGMLSIPERHCERTRALLRASIEISRLENGGSLPPEPSSDRERAHSSLCADEYRKQLRLDPNSPLPPYCKVFLHNFCYPNGIDGTGRSLHFLAECHSNLGNVWYSPSQYGWILYKDGPVATHVKCAVDNDKEFTTTPLLSLSAFDEDLARIDKYGARLALGRGEPSYLFYKALHAISELLAPRSLEPSNVGEIKIIQGNPNSTRLRVATMSFGTYDVLIRVCDQTWRIEAKAIRN